MTDPFAEFQGDDYVLFFFNNRAARFLFRHLWVVALLPAILLNGVLIADWNSIDHDMSIRQVFRQLDDNDASSVVEYMFSRDNKIWWEPDWDCWRGDDVHGQLRIRDSVYTLDVACYRFDTIGGRYSRSVAEDAYQSYDLDDICYGDTGYEEDARQGGTVHTGDGWRTLEQMCNTLTFWDRRINRSLYAMFWLNLTVVTPGSLIMLLLVWLFHGYTRRAPRTFRELYRAGRLRPKPGALEPGTYAGQMLKDLRRWWSRGIGVLVMAAAVLVFVAAGKVGPLLDIFEDYGLDADEYGFENWYLLFSLVIVLTYLLFIPLVIRHVYVVSRYIRRLPAAFDLDLCPRHPDNCHGFKRLGDLSLNIALIFIMPTLIIAFWYQTGILDQAPILLTYIVGVGLGLMIILSLACFLWPLWTIHNCMAQEKTEYQDAATRQLEVVETPLRTLLAAIPPSPNAGEPEEIAKTITTRIDTLKDRRELLLKLYPPDAKFNTWPVNATIWLRFVTPQVLSVLFLIAGMQAGTKDTSFVEKVGEAVSKLLGG